MTPNGPAIKRAERLVTSCYVEIAPPSINLRWPKEEPDCRVWRVSGFSSHFKFDLEAGALPDCRRQAGNAKTLSDWRSQAGVTTAPAIALAKAGQLTFIVRVMVSCYF
jgi:hypothetical protein